MGIDELQASSERRAFTGMGMVLVMSSRALAPYHGLVLYGSQLVHPVEVSFAVRVEMNSPFPEAPEWCTRSTSTEPGTFGLSNQDATAIDFFRLLREGFPRYLCSNLTLSR